MKLRIQRTSQLNSKSRFLQKFRNNVTTQLGEDGIIDAVFNIIGKTNEYCIEFGAWDGMPSQAPNSIQYSLVFPIILNTASMMPSSPSCVVTLFRNFCKNRDFEFS